MYAPLQVFAAKPPSQADIVRHTDLTNHTAFGLVQACLEAEVPPGLVAKVFLCFGSAINLNRHFHCIFLEGVYLDRTEAGLTPRFVTGEPPTDADIAAVITKISHRVIRKLRQLGYLEAGLDAAVATGYDPLRDDAPELARAMAASVQQRLAFGERTGQQVRRIGSGFGAKGEAPRLTGPCCASVQGFFLHANTQVPAHRRDQLERLIRYTARGAVSLERRLELFGSTARPCTSMLGKGSWRWISPSEQGIVTFNS